MPNADAMTPVALVTGLMLLEYFVFSLLVARARVKGQVEAPAITGDPIFERRYRVQLNTVERLVVALPSMWLFGLYISAPIAAGIGLVFIVGRFLYQRGYVADPAKRAIGFGIGMLAETVLLLGAIGGAVLAWLG